VAGFDASDDQWSEYVYGDGSVRTKGKMAPRDLLERVSDAYAAEAALGKSLGFEMCFMHMSYRLMFPGRFLSPYCNKRTDEFGGSVENRARFPLMICEKIKAACGQDFLIEISCSGKEDLPGGVKVEDTIELAMLAQGKVDLLQIRGTSIDPSQPTYLNPLEMPHLETTRKITQALHKAKCTTKVVLVGGAYDLDSCEDAIASGAADFVGSARAWITNPDFGVKAMEGRNDDVVPCLRCNKCHQAKAGDWLSVCSVNPVFGMEHKIDRMVSQPDRKKKIAVIGGGPAGIEAALVSTKRGHTVTLYEKSNRLGGQLNIGGIPYMKWTINKFRDYMVRQVGKSGIRVLFNTEVKPGMLATENYDAVFVALGADPARPPVPGASDVMTAVDALQNLDKVKGDVVIVGGGEVGIETALHLAKNGHKVKVLEMRDALAPECVPIHFRSLFIQEWEGEPNFSFEVNARCTGIRGGKEVVYVDAQGAQKTVKADTVLVAAGMKGRIGEAIALTQESPRTYMIGDCGRLGSIQTALRTAYGIASTL
jgi:thioredoxin reductase